jgi:hypothetical protein
MKYRSRPELLHEHFSKIIIQENTRKYNLRASELISPVVWNTFISTINKGQDWRGRVFYWTAKLTGGKHFYSPGLHVWDVVLIWAFLSSVLLLCGCDWWGTAAPAILRNITSCTSAKWGSTGNKTCHTLWLMWYLMILCECYFEKAQFVDMSAVENYISSSLPKFFWRR